MQLYFPKDSAFGLIHVWFLVDAPFVEFFQHMAIDRGIPQQRSGFFLRSFKMGSINFELIDELCGIRTVVGTTEKMQERHDEALSKVFGVF